MLVHFRVANFRSFKEEQTLSLVAGKDDTHRDNLIACDGFNLLKAVAIYGANASGKSNLIKAIACCRNFILVSATNMNQGDNIPGIVPFKLDAGSRAQPSRFDLIFVADDVRYDYGFSATSDRVHDEWLYAWPRGRKQTWFERRYDPESGGTQWTFRGPLRAAADILSQRTRENGLALSRAAELNIKLLSQVFLWFRRDLLVFDLSLTPDGLVAYTAEHASKDPKFQRRVIQMLESADLGIDEMRILEKPVPEAVARNVDALLAMAGERNRLPAGAAMFELRTLHRQPDSDTVYELAFDEESNGTQRFFALTGPLLNALEKGAAVVVDELDCSMHPLLTRRLIELFQSPEVNKKGAQLVFATHDSTLMNPALFRRDQIWIIDKSSSGASELFSLYDFDTEDRPRNTEAFQRNYLAGRYGGVPSFGPVFEDLTFE